MVKISFLMLQKVMRQSTRGVQTQGQWLDYYSHFHPSPVSLKHFIDFGKFFSTKKLNLFSKYIWMCNVLFSYCLIQIVTCFCKFIRTFVYTWALIVIVFNYNNNRSRSRSLVERRPVSFFQNELKRPIYNIQFVRLPRRNIEKSPCTADRAIHLWTP